MNKVYVIEYRFWNEEMNQWISKISQEGYSNISEARKFCKERSHNSGVTQYPMYFQNITDTSVFEEYYIHEVCII